MEGEAECGSKVVSGSDGSEPCHLGSELCVAYCPDPDIRKTIGIVAAMDRNGENGLFKSGGLYVVMLAFASFTAC